MSFEIGKKCEGLHEGRWYVCTVLASEKDGYSITFDGWSRKFDTVLAPEFVRPRSTIDSRKRKPWTPSINFNKLLPDDEISIDVEGSRKQALVRVVNQVCLSYLTPLISIHVIIVVKLNSTYRDSKSRHVLTTFVMRFSATLVKPWSMHIRIYLQSEQEEGTLEEDDQTEGLGLFSGQLKDQPCLCLMLSTSSKGSTCPLREG